MEQRTNTEQVAQLWCLPEHDNKQVDVGFAADVVKLLDAKDSIIEGLRAEIAEDIKLIEILGEQSASLKKELDRKVADLNAEVERLNNMINCKPSVKS